MSLRNRPSQITDWHPTGRTIHFAPATVSRNAPIDLASLVSTQVIKFGSHRWMESKYG